MIAFVIIAMCFGRAVDAIRHDEPLAAIVALGLAGFVALCESMDDR